MFVATRRTRKRSTPSFSKTIVCFQLPVCFLPRRSCCQRCGYVTSILRYIICILASRFRVSRLDERAPSRYFECVRVDRALLKLSYESRPSQGRRLRFTAKRIVTTSSLEWWLNARGDDSDENAAAEMRDTPTTERPCQRRARSRWSTGASCSRD
jgi:hypothetical protein